MAKRKAKPTLYLWRCPGEGWYLCDQDTYGNSGRACGYFRRDGKLYSSSPAFFSRKMVAITTAEKAGYRVGEPKEKIKVGGVK